MGFTLYRTDDEIKKLWNDFSTETYLLCRSYMQSESAADKALVNVFIDAMKYEQDFENAYNAECWLLLTAESVCLKMLCSWWENDSESAAKFFTDYFETGRDIFTDCASETDADCKTNNKISANGSDDNNITGTFKEIVNIPAKFKLVFFLHLVKGLSAARIAEITGLSVNTVRNRLHRAKKLLNQGSVSGKSDSNDLRSAYLSVSFPEDKSLRLLDFTILKAHDEEFYSNIIPKEEQKDCNNYDNAIYFSGNFDEKTNSMALLKSSLPKLLPGAVCIIVIIIISIWYFINNPM